MIIDDSKMNDSDWTKQLQSMMDTHEEPVPDGLWNDIEARLPQHRKAMPVWLRYAAAAVVTGAVIGTATLLWPTSQTTEGVNPAQSSVAQTVNESDEVAVAKAEPTSAQPIVQAQPSPMPVHLAAAKAQDRHASVDEPSVEAQTAPTAEAAPTTARDTVTEQPDKPLPLVTPSEEPLYASATPSRTVAPVSQKTSVTVGFYATNQFPDLRGNGGDFECMPSDTPYNPNIDPQDSIPHETGNSAGRRAPHRVMPQDERVEHHAPYSLGVSVSIPLSARFALTTGLVYTRLKSDFSNREQTLHYIGVPLGATYSLWQWRFVNVYAIGGMQADFNVKATLRQQEHASDLHMGKDRVQFSAMLGPGLQFNLNKDFGIYIEPTARYYFNNGSDVLNYFKDKPWNINFNAGLRLTID